MPDYIGDFRIGDVVREAFNTHDAGGAPIGFDGGTATVKWYKDGGAVEATTGITLTQDFDGKTGRHLVEIDTAGFGAGDYFVFISAGAVDAISVVGVDVFHFSVENRKTQVAGIDAGVITATAIAANAIAAAKIAADAIAALAVPVLAKLPAALTGAGNLKVDALAINGSANAAIRLALAAAGMVVFTAQTGTLSTTQATTDLVLLEDGQYRHRSVLIITGLRAGQVTSLSDTAVAGGLLTFTEPLTDDLANGDIGIIV